MRIVYNVLPPRGQSVSRIENTVQGSLESVGIAPPVLCRAWDATMKEEGVCWIGGAAWGTPPCAPRSRAPGKGRRTWRRGRGQGSLRDKALGKQPRGRVAGGCRWAAQSNPSFPSLRGPGSSGAQGRGGSRGRPGPRPLTPRRRRPTCRPRRRLRGRCRPEAPAPPRAGRTA